VRIQIVAVGRVRSGPEMDLALDYLSRADAGGRHLGLTPIALTEVEGRPAGDTRREAEAVIKATPPGARTILLDERGEDWTSRTLSETIARWRDAGDPCLSFWIGGADGAAPELKSAARGMLRLGSQTWPHRLVRAMIAEQVYRAVTILSANPYHRD
jgi:23S rRNA (pseudouridine1915-N3)-methyltransferase